MPDIGGHSGHLGSLGSLNVEKPLIPHYSCSTTKLLCYNLVVI